jgi:hypothetical protein
MPWDNNEEMNKARYAQCAVVIPRNPVPSYSSIICSLKWLRSVCNIFYLALLYKVQSIEFARKNLDLN